MNSNVLKGKWKQIRGRATEQWGQIVDHDLDKIIGKREQLVGLMQEKYGYTRDNAEQDVDFILKKMNLRHTNNNHVSSILAAFIGSLLTIAVFTVFARRQANA